MDKQQQLQFIGSGEGFPIVWIHGFPLAAEIFRPQLDIPGYRHIAPDLPGFGNSGPFETDEVSMDDYAACVLSLLDQLSIGRALFAGVSMGGYILFAIAKLARERAAGLILIDTRAGADSDEGERKRYETIAAVKENGTKVVIDQMLPKMLTPGTLASSDPARTITERVMLQASERGCIGALRAMAGRPDSSELLTSLDLPVLIAVGAEDTLTPPADSRFMADKISGATLLEIPNAAHLSHLERPEKFNDGVTGFLKRHRIG